MDRQKTILTIENQPQNLPLLKEIVQQLPGAIEFHSLNVKELNHDNFLTIPYAPSLIILNLNLAEEEILALIKRIKQESNCQIVPLVVLTSHCSPDEVKNYYYYGASGALCQPVSQSDLSTTLELMLEYWFKVVVLPY
ncbi:MAG: hypothetical protein Cpurp_09025 [Chlorogloea purpurea SAG 13.99]|jgi:DNA-binding NarL/FixJ family response regulator|nr:hypothetical protein [Chlorogloea purpurea SAG 13.99]